MTRSSVYVSLLRTLILITLVMPRLCQPHQPSGSRFQRVVRAIVISLEILTAISAFSGGISMISDPAGAMGLAPEMLDRLPVDSWVLPGVALIVCNGVLPTAGAVAEVRRRLWPRRFGHALAGAVLLAWPVAETLIFGYPLAGEPVWLRPAVAFVGIALIGLGFTLRHLDDAIRTSASMQQRGSAGVHQDPQILGRGNQGR